MLPTYDEIQTFCVENGDAEQSDKYRRFFTEGYDAYGVHPTLLESHRDQYFSTIDWVKERADALDLGDQLVSSGKYEEGTYAFYLACALRDQEMTLDEFTRITGWFRDDGLRNWAHVDMMARDLLAPYLLKTEDPLGIIAHWRKDPSKWKRRAAAVSCVYLVDHLPIESLLAYIEPLLNDPDKPVQQGVGWLLKKAWKRQPDTVEAFLKPRVSRAATVTLQIAREKMPEEKKERFRKLRKKRA